MNLGNVNVPQGFDSFGPWLNETFEHFKANWQPWLLISLVYMLVVGAAYGIVYLMALVLGDVGGSLAGIVSWVVSMFMMPGLYRAGLKQVRGQTVDLSDLFAETGMFGTALVISLAIAAGVIACGVGVLVTGTLFCLALPYAVDRRASIGEALSASYEATKQNFFFFLIYMIVVWILGSIGSILCGIGAILTFPILIIGAVVAYERVFNPSAGQAMPADPLDPIV